MAEEPMNEPRVTDMELMKKLNRFMREARMNGQPRPGMGRPPMPPFPPQGMGRRPMPPFPPQENGRPPMPPFPPQENGRPPMPPFPPQENGRPPMPPFPPQENGRPPMPGFGPRGNNQPPFSRERMLVIIGDNPDGIRQKALAEKMGINQSSTSELVDKLESSGYIVRKVDPNDRRATLLFLTELGTARAEEVRKEQEDTAGSIFARLTEEEKQTFASLLDKLLDEPKQK